MRRGWHGGGRREARDGEAPRRGQDVEAKMTKLVEERG